MQTLTDERIEELQERADAIRTTVIEMLVEAGSGHTAGPLGMADLFAALYFHIVRHDPKNPDWPERDRLILSNGHCVPVRYAAMAHAGYFPLEETKTLRKFGSRLQGHPERTKLPGLETTSGPLGSGLSQAAGIAYGAELDGMQTYTYCMMSDGEQDAGHTWEAALFAGKNKLANLIGIIDRNNIQINGYTEDVMPLESLREKYEAFNWHVQEVDGHNMRQIVEAVGQAQAIYEKPSLIIAHTVPGKGVPEIEFDFAWHGKPPSEAEAKRFIKDIRTMRGQVACIDCEE